MIETAPKSAMERALRLLRACTHCGEFFMPEGIGEHERICFARMTWGEMRKVLDDGSETLLTTNAYTAVGIRVGLIVPAQRLLEQMGLEQWEQLGTFYRLKVDAPFVGKPMPADAPSFMVPIGTMQTVPIAEVVRQPALALAPTSEPTSEPEPIRLENKRVACPFCHEQMHASGYPRHSRSCAGRFTDDQIRAILDDGSGHILNIALYDSSAEWRQGLPTATTLLRQLRLRGWRDLAVRFGLSPNSTSGRVPKPEPEPEPTDKQVSGDPAPFSFAEPVIRVLRRGQIRCEFCHQPYDTARIVKHQKHCYARFTLQRVRDTLDDGTGTIMAREKWDTGPRERGGLPSSETLMKQLGLHYWNEIAHYFNLKINLLPGRPRNTKLYVAKRVREKRDEVQRALLAKETPVVVVDERDHVVAIKRTGVTGDRRMRLASLSRATVRDVLDVSQVIVEKPLENGMTMVRKMLEGGGYSEVLMKDGKVVKESTLGKPL